MVKKTKKIRIGDIPILLKIYFFRKCAVLSAVSCRLTKLTGKYPVAIHPKHLIPNTEDWFGNHISKKDTVLDIGSHKGEITFKIAKKCQSITGIDYDRNFLSEAKLFAKSKRINNARFLFHDMEEKMPSSNNEFSVVLFFAVLEHLKKRKQALVEIKRILKPHGKLFLSVPNNDTSWRKLQRSYGFSSYVDPDHEVEFSKNEIKKLLESCGFKNITILPVSYDTPWRPWIDLVGGINLGLYKMLSQLRVRKAKQNIEESGSFNIIASK